MMRMASSAAIAVAASVEEGSKSSGGSRGIVGIVGIVGSSGSNSGSSNGSSNGSRGGRGSGGCKDNKNDENIDNIHNCYPHGTQINHRLCGMAQASDEGTAVGCSVAIEMSFSDEHHEKNESNEDNGDNEDNEDNEDKQSIVERKCDPQSERPQLTTFPTFPSETFFTTVEDEDENGVELPAPPQSLTLSSFERQSSNLLSIQEILEDIGRNDNGSGENEEASNIVCSNKLLLQPLSSSNYTANAHGVSPASHTTSSPQSQTSQTSQTSQNNATTSTATNSNNKGRPLSSSLHRHSMSKEVLESKLAPVSITAAKKETTAATTSAAAAAVTTSEAPTQKRFSYYDANAVLAIVDSKIENKRTDESSDTSVADIDSRNFTSKTNSDSDSINISNSLTQRIPHMDVNQIVLDHEKANADHHKLQHEQRIVERYDYEEDDDSLLLSACSMTGGSCTTGLVGNGNISVTSSISNNDGCSQYFYSNNVVMAAAASVAEMNSDNVNDTKSSLTSPPISPSLPFTSAINSKLRSSAAFSDAVAAKSSAFSVRSNNSYSRNLMFKSPLATPVISTKAGTTSTANSPQQQQVESIADKDEDAQVSKSLGRLNTRSMLRVSKASLFTTPSKKNTQLQQHLTQQKIQEKTLPQQQLQQVQLLSYPKLTSNVGNNADIGIGNFGSRRDTDSRTSCSSSNPSPIATVSDAGTPDATIHATTPAILAAICSSRREDESHNTHSEEEKVHTTEKELVSSIPHSPIGSTLLGSRVSSRIPGSRESSSSNNNSKSSSIINNSSQHRFDNEGTLSLDNNIDTVTNNTLDTPSTSCCINEMEPNKDGIHDGGDNHGDNDNRNDDDRSFEVTLTEASSSLSTTAAVEQTSVIQQQNHSVFDKALSRNTSTIQATKTLRNTIPSQPQRPPKQLSWDISVIHSPKEIPAVCGSRTVIDNLPKATHVASGSRAVIENFNLSTDSQKRMSRDYEFNVSLTTEPLTTRVTNESVGIDLSDDGDDNDINFKGTSLSSSSIVSSSASSRVLYCDGATDLFLAIEECDWDRVEQICTTDPQQASVYVVSTGTIQTTFHWSIWERLPIHEIARRHPPVHIVAKLVQAYPDGCRAVTQFGELPLHLALECGASPAVVFFLALCHWRGMYQPDQSGRTPVDVYRDVELLLDPTEHAMIGTALSLSTATYNEMCAEHDHAVHVLNAHHQSGLREVRCQHDRDLALEHEQQDALVQNVIELHRTIKIQATTAARQEQEISRKQQQIESLQSSFDSAQQQLDIYCSIANERHDRIGQLENVIVQQRNTIRMLEQQTRQLQLELRRAATPFLATTGNILADSNAAAGTKSTTTIKAPSTPKSTTTLSLSRKSKRNQKRPKQSQSHQDTQQIKCNSVLVGVDELECNANGQNVMPKSTSTSRLNQYENNISWAVQQTERKLRVALKQCTALSTIIKQHGSELEQTLVNHNISFPGCSNNDGDVDEDKDGSGSGRVASVTSLSKYSLNSTHVNDNDNNNNNNNNLGIEEEVEEEKKDDDGGVICTGENNKVEATSARIERTAVERIPKIIPPPLPPISKTASTKPKTASTKPKTASTKPKTASTKQKTTTTTMNSSDQKRGRSHNKTTVINVSVDEIDVEEVEDDEALSQAANAASRVLLPLLKGDNDSEIYNTTTCGKEMATAAKSTTSIVPTRTPDIVALNTATSATSITTEKIGHNNIDIHGISTSNNINNQKITDDNVHESRLQKNNKVSSVISVNQASTITEANTSHTPLRSNHELSNTPVLKLKEEVTVDDDHHDDKKKCNNSNSNNGSNTTFFLQSFALNHHQQQQRLLTNLLSPLLSATAMLPSATKTILPSVETTSETFRKQSSTADSSSLCKHSAPATPKRSIRGNQKAFTKINSCSDSCHEDNQIDGTNEIDSDEGNSSYSSNSYNSSNSSTSSINSGSSACSSSGSSTSSHDEDYDEDYDDNLDYDDGGEYDDDDGARDDVDDDYDPTWEYRRAKKQSKHHVIKNGENISDIENGRTLNERNEPSQAQRYQLQHPPAHHSLFDMSNDGSGSNYSEKKKSIIGQISSDNHFYSGKTVTEVPQNDMSTNVIAASPSTQTNEKNNVTNAKSKSQTIVTNSDTKNLTPTITSASTFLSSRTKLTLSSSASTSSSTSKSKWESLLANVLAESAAPSS